MGLEACGPAALLEKHGLPGEVRLQGTGARVLLGTSICVVSPGCENTEKSTGSDLRDNRCS